MPINNVSTALCTSQPTSLTPLTDRPLLLGKRGLHAVYPARAEQEKRRRLTGLPLAPPAGLPLRGTLGALDVVVQCSGGSELLHAAGARPSIKPQNMVFVTGDPFVILDGHFAGKTLAITQGLGATTAQTCDRLVEALQALWVARAANSREHLVLVLPQQCDPQVSPTAFNRLIARLAKASGAREIHYRADVNSAPCSAGTLTDAAFAAQTTAAIASATCYEQADALRAIAYTQFKQAGRRDLAAQEAQWQGIAQKAALVASALPSAAVAESVVFGVQVSCALRDSVAVSLQTTGAAQVGEHQFSRVHPDVQLTTDVRGKDVVIINGQRPAAGDGSADITNPTMTIEALLLVQAAREAGARRVSVVEAYQMNGRSDIEEHTQDAKGETHAAAYCALVAKWFDAVKCSDAVLIENHDTHTPTYWSDSKHAHAQSIDGARLMVQQLMAELTPDEQQNTVLALPDAGSVKRTKQLRKLFSLTFEGQKIRTTHGGEPNLTSMGDKPIPPHGVVVLTDDETATGSTLAQALCKLREQGATTMHALLTHNNLPLDVVQRNLLLAWFRASGATTVRFTDTHAMGPVVSSYAQLLTLGATPAQVAAAVQAFITARHLQVTPEALFADLVQAVKVVPVAPAIAQALATPNAAPSNALTARAPTLTLAQAGQFIRHKPDFPKAGVDFLDFRPLLRNPAARATVIDALVERYAGRGIQQIVGLESRGFFLAEALANRLGCGWVMMRKPGKTPPPFLQSGFNKEYGSDTLQVAVGDLAPGETVLILDDVAATGGSLAAAVELTRRCGAIPQAAVIKEVPGMAARKVLADMGVDLVTVIGGAL